MASVVASRALLSTQRVAAMASSALFATCATQVRRRSGGRRNLRFAARYESFGRNTLVASMREGMEEVEGISTRKNVASVAALLRSEVPRRTVFTKQTEYISILGSLLQNAEGERAEVNRPLNPHPSA